MEGGGGGRERGEEGGGGKGGWGERKGEEGEERTRLQRGTRHAGTQTLVVAMVVGVERVR